MNIDLLQDASKALVEVILQDMKRMFSQTGNLMPSGYHLIYDEANINSDKDAVIAVPMPHIHKCFESRDAKAMLSDFIKHVTNQFNMHCKKPSEKIIGVVVINDAYYYEEPPGTNIDPDNAVLPEYHPNRKEAIVGMLYFKDSIWSYSIPYLRGETRILFENLISKKEEKLVGQQANLYPHEYAL